MVQPIRNTKTIREIINHLKKADDKRNLLLFVMGVYTGLRISDMLKLRIGDVKNKKNIKIKEKKTNNIRIIQLHSELYKELYEYTYEKDPDDYLFKSRQGYNNAISRTQAYRILKNIEEKFRLDNLGTHSLRKTFGYQMYNASKKDIVKVQKALGHTNINVTLRYIGIEQESINDTMLKLDYS